MIRTKGRLGEVGLSASAPVIGILNLVAVLRFLPTEEMATWSTACASLTILSIAGSPFSLALMNLGVVADGRGRLILRFFRFGLRLLIPITVCFLVKTLAVGGLGSAWATFFLSYLCRLKVEAIGLYMQSSGRFGADKIVRLACPFTSLVSILLFQPQNFVDVVLCVSAAYCLVGIFLALDREPASKFTEWREVLAVFGDHSHGLLIGVVSLLIYAVPVLLFSRHARDVEQVSLALGVQLISSSTLFFSFASARRSVLVARMIANLSDGSNRLVFPLLSAVLVALGASAAIMGYGVWKSVPVVWSLALAVFVSVLVELGQSFVMGLRVRLGDTRVLLNALASGVSCSLSAQFFDSAVAVLFSMAGAQFSCYLLPNYLRLRTFRLRLSGTVIR